MPVDGETLLLGISIGILGAFPLLAAFFVLYQRYTKAVKLRAKVRDLEAGEFKPPIPSINFSSTTLPSTIPSSRNDSRLQGRSNSRSPARNEKRNNSRSRATDHPATLPHHQLKVPPKVILKNQHRNYYSNPFDDSSVAYSSRNVSRADSRTDSRNESRAYSRNESRGYSRNESRNASRNQNRGPVRPKLIIPSSTTEATYINDQLINEKPLPQLPPGVIHPALRDGVSEKDTGYLPAKVYPPNDSFGHKPRTPPRAPSKRETTEAASQTLSPQTAHQRTPKTPKTPAFLYNGVYPLPAIPKNSSNASRRPSTATNISSRTNGTTIRRPSKAIRQNLKSLAGSIRSRLQSTDSPVSPCQSSMLRYARTPHEASPATPFSFPPKTPKEPTPDVRYNPHVPTGYPLNCAELAAERSSGSVIDSSETDASSQSSESTMLFDRRSLEQETVHILIGVENLGREDRTKA